MLGGRVLAGFGRTLLRRVGAGLAGGIGNGEGAFC